ncbi:hypothetical protein AMJ85_06080 [candidate division BRC1 bacterium SM23_51]|nr:MAG: hypothetical protein AMJ85_06080 [candidate division BRC1 bacterium SM23_51]
MSSPLYPIACPFEDCLYHVRLAIQNGQAFCSHPDKSRFRGSESCPLYQYNWAKRLDTMGQ